MDVQPTSDGCKLGEESAYQKLLIDPSISTEYKSVADATILTKSQQPPFFNTALDLVFNSFLLANHLHFAALRNLPRLFGPRLGWTVPYLHVQLPV